MIESEDFQFKGKWVTDKDNDCLGKSLLRVHGGGSSSEQLDALTVIDIKEEGEYIVWVRAADYNDKPGTRLFQLHVDEQAMKISGAHGQVGFYWENAGKIVLSKKQVLLRLHDTKRNFARCDAILLSKDNAVDPNTLSKEEIAKWRKKPVEMQTNKSSFDNVSSPIVLDQKTEDIANIANANIRISFVKGGTNNHAIACKTEVKVNGQWRRFLSMSEDHKIYLITSNNSPIDYNRFYPSWSSVMPNSSFAIDNKKYAVQTEEDFMNPFLSGELSEAIPVNVEKLNYYGLKIHRL